MTTSLPGSRQPRTSGGGFVGRDEMLSGLAAFLFDPARRRTGLAFLSGPPGSGKSTLAGHVLTRRTPGDWVVAFKFDQYLAAAPARFFVAALESIAGAILGLPEPQRVALVRRLIDAVSPNGQILLDLCPAMGEVLGAQPDPIELGPLENQIRLSLVLRRFFQALTASGIRLFLFIDDLQWADGATMRLLGDLVVDPQITGLSVVAAFRQGQDDNALRLRRAVHIIGNPTHEVSLGGLTPEAITALIGERVTLPAEASASLAERIGRATDGNPLAVVNVIALMIEKGAIRPAQDGRAAEIAPEAAPGLLEKSAVDVLMRSRLEGLGAATRDLLGLAANVGDTFDAALLQDLAGIAAADLDAEIDALLQEDILVAAEESARGGTARDRSCASPMTSCSWPRGRSAARATRTRRRSTCAPPAPSPRDGPRPATTTACSAP